MKRRVLCPIASALIGRASTLTHLLRSPAWGRALVNATTTLANTK